MLAGEGHFWARHAREESYTTDFRVQFRLKLIQGDIHLVYRLNSTGRYFIGFNQNGTQLHKQYWPDTFLEGLVRSTVPHSLGAWHRVEIVGQAERLQLWVDGQMEWEYADPEPLLTGSFAFETLDASTAYVDDIVVYGPAPTRPTTPVLSQTWVRTGGPLGGLGYDIRMRPDNPDILYVTDAWAGVFMSTDGGQTWYPANSGITTRTGESGDAIPVFCLTIDPHNYDTLWAGTQNVCGIFKSIDGGRTWVEMDNGVVEQFGITFRGFTVDPRSPDIVYAAAELSSWVWAGEERQGREFDMTAGVVYKTTDSGQNWTAIWRGNNLARYVWIDPRNPDVIYVSTGIFDREAANSDSIAGTPGGEGVVKSTDGGQTWANANSGLNNTYVGALFMHPANPDILLAGVGNVQYHEGAGVYISTDGGASWSPANDALSQNANVTALAVTPDNPLVVYAATGNHGLLRSADGGRSWTALNVGLSADSVALAVAVHPTNANSVYVGLDRGGLLHSSDGGATWTFSGIGLHPEALVSDIIFDPTNPQVMYATDRFSGVYRSDDGGATWNAINDGLRLRAVNALVITSDGQHLYAAPEGEGVFRLDLNGAPPSPAAE